MISSFNAQTISAVAIIGELAYNAEIQGINVICTQEHWFYHPEIIGKHIDVGKNWTLVTNSAWKNEINATIG